FGNAKDPDEYVRVRGISAWNKLIEARECGVSWRALELAGELTEQPDVRRAALRRAGTWLGSLPPRLALEQEDAVRAIAGRCGYSVPAVERAFRARYWSERARAVESGVAQGL